MQFEPTPLAGLTIIRPKLWPDARGFFLESWRADTFAAAGLVRDWVQENHARSTQGTLRGLHYQRGRGQAKLIRCARGTIWDVALDLRADSPTRGQWFGMELSDADQAMLFIPEGFAHGYAVLSDVADVLYKVDRVYDGALEDGIRWNDPELGVKWPVEQPLLSPRDQQAQSWHEYLARH